MYLLEEYSELIERDSTEISFLWKGLQMFTYFLSVLSGYSCAILFYILWQDIFAGQCPLWAKLDLSKATSKINNEHLHGSATIESNYTDWKQYVIISYDYEDHCKFFFAMCFLSCIFGIVWLTLFTMCGRGGYDVRMQVTIIGIYIFTSPWRIVFPAMLFNLCLTVITLYATSDMQNGYLKFSNDLMLLFVKISEIYTSKLHAKECTILQDYVSLYITHEHDVCNMFYVLEIMSWIMVWSWIIGFIILLMRFIMAIDFKLLKIRVFEILNEASIHAYRMPDQNEAQKRKEE